MTKNILRAAVAGGGSWGTALAHVLACAGHAVTIVLRDEAVAKSINETHENPRYLPGRTLHENVQASVDTNALCEIGRAHV